MPSRSPISELESDSSPVTRQCLPTQATAYAGSVAVSQVGLPSIEPPRRTGAVQLPVAALSATIRFPAEPTTAAQRLYWRGPFFPHHLRGPFPEGTPLPRRKKSAQTR